METKLELIDLLIGFERRICRIYEKWAASDAFSEEVRAFWRDMAEDEKQHLAILEKSAGLLNFAVALPQFTSEQIKEMTARILGVERASDKQPLATDDVFRYALELESSEFDDIDDAWLHSFQPDVGNLAQSWKPAHDRHIRRLAAAVSRFTTDRELLKQAADLLSDYERKQTEQQV